MTLERLADTDAWVWERLQLLARNGWDVSLTPAFGGGSLIVIERDGERFGREFRDGTIVTCRFKGAQMSWESERAGTLSDAISDLTFEASQRVHQRAVVRQAVADQLPLFGT